MSLLVGDDVIAEAARSALGDQGPEDFHLAPLQHAELLGQPADPLRKILESAPVSNVARRYQAANAGAIEAQSRYKRAIRWVIRLRVFAIMFGACYFIQPPSGEISRAVGEAANASRIMPEPAVWSGVLFVLQFLSLVASTGLIQLVAYKGWYKTWKQDRANAETARVELFNTVLAGAIASTGALKPGELPALPLALEYFRRYQLQVQRNFYATRTIEASEALGWKWSLWMLGWAFVIATGLHLIVFNMDFVSNFSSLWDAVSWVASGQFGAYAMMLTTMYSGLLLGHDLNSQVTFDRRNAVAYARMRDTLDLVLRDADHVLSDVRRLAAKASREKEDTEKVVTFFVNLQQHVIDEHGEWRLLSQHMPQVKDLLRTSASPVRAGLPE